MGAWTPPDWRDASAYALIVAGGRPALAWEVLRRDPAYRAFADGADAVRTDGSEWGLHFRC